MTELGPYAHQLLEYLRRDTVFAGAYRPEPLFHQWDNYVQRVSFFNRYPDMTDHGRAHANSVVALVAQLSIPPLGQQGPLNASEIFCLTGAAWLHDIGMFTTVDTGDDIFDPMSIRARHCCLSRDRMREERDVIFPGLPREDVWIISAIAAYHQSRTVIDDGHRQVLEELAAVHERPLTLVPGMPTLEAELESQGWCHGVASLAKLLKPGQDPRDAKGFRQPIRVKLLAALLRLLDQCDIQTIRAGSIDFLVRRASRSMQQQRLYQKFREAFVSRDGSTDGLRLQERLDAEIKFFSETHNYCLRDFWVERTFIVGNRIVIKMNDWDQVRAQLALVPPSLSGAKELVLAASLDPDRYREHARDYVMKELAPLGDRYLKAAGLDLKVEDYPSERKARRALQLDLRARGPYVDPAPPRPPAFADFDVAKELANRLTSGDEGRIAVVYGPQGRGRKQFCLSLAQDIVRRRGDGDFAAIWWHPVERGPQETELVRSAGTYLASHGEYALFNVMHDDTLVTRKHFDFFLNLIRRAELPHVIVIQDLNRVEPASRGYFRELFQILEGKVVVITTTRWPSPRAARDLFGDVENQVRFLACPRAARAGGQAALAKIARRARFSSRQATTTWVEECTASWEAWGREGAFLALASEHAWLLEAQPASFPLVIERKMQSQMLEIWERLGNRGLALALLELSSPRGQPDQRLAGRVEAVPVESAMQELVDRDLARWELSPEANPWLADDSISLSFSRCQATPAAWIHPGLVRCLSSQRS